MGCFDIYCDVCAGPFTPYNCKYYPGIADVDTAWLDEAIIEYDNKVKIPVSNYNSYGAFTDKNGTEHIVAEKQYYKEVKVYHTVCEFKTPKRHLKGYQQQHFNIDKVIEDNNQHLLNKSFVITTYNDVVV